MNKKNNRSLTYFFNLFKTFLIIQYNYLKKSNKLTPFFQLFSYLCSINICKHESHTFHY